MPEPRFTLNDIKELGHWLYGVDLPESDAQRIYAKLVKLASRSHGWATKELNGTSCGIAIWLKSRLLEDGLLECSQSAPRDIHLECELNVFFIHIEETPEQLAKLRNEKSGGSKHKPARSRIVKFMEKRNPVPIDATAKRVAPPPDDIN